MKNTIMKSHFTTWLLASLTVAVLMIIARMFYTNDLLFRFLLWNLFLASLPYFFADRLVKSETNNSGWQYIWFGLWILFFPNAPYIITDLFHLRERRPVPLWFDTAMLFFAAWNGLLLGILSMMKVESVLMKKFGHRISPILVSLCFLACGFGIYAGRYLRWNSWDLFLNPDDLMKEFAHRVLHPLHYSGAWAMATLFGLFTTLIYFTIRKLTQFKPS